MKKICVVFSIFVYACGGSSQLSSDNVDSINTETSSNDSAVIIDTGAVDSNID